MAIVRPCRLAARFIKEDSRKGPLRHSNTNTLQPSKLGIQFHLRRHRSSGVVEHRRSEEEAGAGILGHRSLVGGPVGGSRLDTTVGAAAGSIPPDQAEVPEAGSIVAAAGRRRSNPC